MWPLMSKCCCYRNPVDGDGLNGACACWMGCGTCSVLEAVVVAVAVVVVSLSMMSKLRYRAVGRRDCLFHSGYLFRTFFTKREKHYFFRTAFILVRNQCYTVNCALKVTLQAI